MPALVFIDYKVAVVNAVGGTFLWRKEKYPNTLAGTGENVDCTSTCALPWALSNDIQWSYGLDVEEICSLLIEPV